MFRYCSENYYIWNSYGHWFRYFRKIELIFRHFEHIAEHMSEHNRKKRIFH